METVAATPQRRFGDGGSSLAEVGEAEVLRALAGIARAVPGKADLVVATGDDAAVWRAPAGDVVISQDALVEGEDFRREWLTPEALGARALQAALSDLAAMGARPMLCLASLCAGAGTQVEDVMAIQRGLCAAAATTGCRVAGGDLSAIEGPIVLDVVVVGTVAPGRVLRHDAGLPGDWLVVTGHVGRAAAGLKILLGDLRAPVRPADLWVEAQLHPRARIEEGLALAEGGVRCAADLSDGLIVDLGRILDASGCGAEIWRDRLPVDPELGELLADHGDALALGGGEDYELVAAVPEALLQLVQAGWPQGLAPLSVIGRLETEAGLRLRNRPQGDPVPLPEVAARHFRR